MKIRKIVTTVEETRLEMGKTIDPPTRRAASTAVIENPFAGQYQEDLDSLMTIGEELGDLLGRNCVAALGIDPQQTESYGKAAMVGENGELEHAAAILHPKLGKPLRQAVEKARHWCHHQRRWGLWGNHSMCHSVTRMPPMCVRTLTVWKFESTTHHAPMKLWCR